MLLLAFFACGPEELVKTCSEVETVVADDVELDLGFTVADLVSDANLDALPVNNLQGERLTISLAVNRGEGDAALVDKTIETESLSGVGPSQHITYEFNDGCMDEVTVPVSVTLLDDAGTVNIQAEGTLYTADDGTMYSGVTLEASFDPATSTFPVGFRADPAFGSLFALFPPDYEPTLTVWITAADGAQEAVISTPGRQL